LREIGPSFELKQPSPVGQELAVLACLLMMVSTLPIKLRSQFRHTWTF
jgi:hypothetical protein